MTNEELCDAIQAGQNVKESLEALWEQNRGLIRKTGAPYRGFYEPDDVMQEGFLALHKAAVTYDSSQGAAFVSWLSNMLKWHFSGWNRQQPDQKELLILNSPMKTDEDGTVTELDLTVGDAEPDLEAEDAIMEEEIRETVKRCVDSLAPKEAEVIRARFFFLAPLDAISEQMGITKASVEVLRRKALDNLKRRHGKELRPCLDALDEMRYSCGMKGTGIWRFNTTWTSATENAALQAIRREDDRLRNDLLRKYVFNDPRRSQSAPLMPSVHAGGEM